MTSRTHLAQDYRHAVASEFAARPTVRQVAATHLLSLLAAAHPAVAAADLPDADSIVLLIPQASETSSSAYVYWARQPLVEALLESMIRGEPLRSRGLQGGEFMIVAGAEHPFRDAQGLVQDGALSIDAQLDAIDALRQTLVQQFCQAQVDYWSAPGSLGVSRDRWLQLIIKFAWLENLPLQGLDRQQTACIHGLLKGGEAQPAVFAVEAHLTSGTGVRQTLLPNLLIDVDYDERRILLWCAPSSVIRAFDTLEAFEAALCDELAEHYCFETLTWTRYSLEGDPFARQSALLLEGLLDALGETYYWQCKDPETLDDLFATLSDPSAAFIEGYRVDSQPALVLPIGLRHLSPADGFACQAALFELALAQSDASGCTSRDAILDLRQYARQQLRQALLADHPDDANYFPDDLLLTLRVAHGQPGGAGVGPGDGHVQTYQASFLDYAIGAPGAYQDAVLIAVEHRQGQLIMDWLTPRYLDALVRRVDIGGHYPAYVARAMDEPRGRAQRIACFAREWRCSLLSAALEAKLAGTLDEAALQCVVDYCRGQVDRRLPAIALMPLAFLSEPKADTADVVRGMYVLFSAEPRVVILYRPLYRHAPLRAFKSLEALFAAIASPGDLHDSVLDWLPAQARRVYDHGGFREPHRLQPIEDDSTGPSSAGPAVLQTRFWLDHVDDRLYQANRDLLIELADRQSLSDAERRWASLVQGAWLLFDVVSLILRGPAAAVAWLVQGVASLEHDLPALVEGTAFERSAAVVDLVLGLGMAVAHTLLPAAASPHKPRLSKRLIPGALRTPEAMPLPRSIEPVRGPAMSVQGLADRRGTQLEFAWHGTRGFNVLPADQRERLLALRSGIDLTGHSATATGLYAVNERLYVIMQGDVYHVELAGDGVRVMGERGEPGPWLVLEFGVWRVDARLRLRGGMPKGRLQLLREKNRKRLETLKDDELQLTDRRNELSRVLGMHRDLLLDKTAQIRALEAVEQPSELQVRELTMLRDLGKRIRETVVYDIKALIDNGLKHDRLMNDIAELRHGEPLLDETVQVHRSATRKELLEHCEIFYNEIAALINAESLEALADTIAIRPEGEDEIRQYHAYREVLAKVVKWEADLVEVSRQFEGLLASTLSDSSIDFKDDDTGARLNKHRWLADITRQHRLNAVDIEFRLLIDLGELSIDRLSGADERTLRRIEAGIAGEALRSAGSAHGELAGSDLPLEAQISVLNGVLEGYEETLVSLDYLSNVSGNTLRAETLKRYRETLERLKALAEKELAEAVREKELAEPRVPRPTVYPSRGGGRRHVVRTQRGRSVVGVEAEVDGVAVIEQRDAHTNQVLKTFRQHGSEWFEDASAPIETPTPVQDPGALRQRAQALIAEVESVIRLARQYVKPDEPHGLASVIDWHVEKLLTVQAKLPRSDLDEALHRSLTSSIERLQAARQDLLTGLHLSTSHPTAQSLAFLMQHGQVTLARVTERKMLGPGDYLDVYQIRRLPRPGQERGQGLWEAHFHYPSATAPGRAFSKGHLKLWSQRKLGREAQLRAAATGKDLLAIYRSDLRLEQMEGLIPFD